VQGAATTLIFAVVIVAAVVGVMSLIGRRGPYDEIADGRGRLALQRTGDDPEGSGSGTSAPGAPGAHAERDLEIRQMLEARSARRVRAGEAPLDIEAELLRLTDGDHGLHRADPERDLEIRQMLEARSARRVRAGEAPLDIEAELVRLTRPAQGG
jgi:hypothetical protein